MAETNNTANTPDYFSGKTLKQVSTVLDEISSHTGLAHDLCTLAIMETTNGEQGERCSRLILSAESLLNQIGWMADLCGAANESNAEEWLLPPCFKYEGNQEATQ